MRNIQVITDSCSDLSGELMEKYGIDYARMRTIRDGKETPASLLWEYYSPKEFYDVIRGGERITTTQVPQEEFHEIFVKYLEAGCDIIYIACASKQSSSVNTAQVVAKKVLTDYPEARIACIDAMRGSIGEGMLAIKAAELAREGKVFDEIVATVEGLRNNVVQYLTVQTLEYLRRCGRVTATSAFFGNLMGIKPILIADADGVQTPIKKAKGRANSIREMVSLMKENIIDAESQTVYVINADCIPEEIELMKQLIRAEIPCRDIVVLPIGPIIGASVGPDSIGILAFGKEVTYRVGAAK